MNEKSWKTMELNEELFTSSLTEETVGKEDLKRRELGCIQDFFKTKNIKIQI